MDLGSRRIVGWSMSERMKMDLTLTMLQMAIDERAVPFGLIHHSDQGSQYTDRRYQVLLRAHKMRPSMNGVGTCPSAYPLNKGKISADGRVQAQTWAVGHPLGLHRQKGRKKAIPRLRKSDSSGVPR